MTPLPPIHARGARRRSGAGFPVLTARRVWATASRGLASLPVPPSRRRAAAHTQG